MIGCLALLTLLIGVAAGATISSSPRVEQWGVFEVALTGPTNGNPFVDVHFAARFTQGTNVGRSAGLLRWRRRLSRALHAGETGTMALHDRQQRAGTERQDRRVHGHQTVRRTITARCAWRTRITSPTPTARPYKQLGTTCYAWTHQTESVGGADAQDARRVAVQQAPLLRLSQALHVEHQRAADAIRSKARRRQLGFHAVQSRVLSAFRTAHPRAAQARHRGGPHPVSSLRRRALGI